LGVARNACPDGASSQRRLEDLTGRSSLSGLSRPVFILAYRFRLVHLWRAAVLPVPLRRAFSLAPAETRQPPASGMVNFLIKFFSSRRDERVKTS
jgi:hypothetical protein